MRINQEFEKLYIKLCFKYFFFILFWVFFILCFGTSQLSLYSFGLSCLTQNIQLILQPSTPRGFFILWMIHHSVTILTGTFLQHLATQKSPFLQFCNLIEKTANILRRYHWFPCVMMSEKQG